MESVRTTVCDFPCQDVWGYKLGTLSACYFICDYVDMEVSIWKDSIFGVGFDTRYRLLISHSSKVSNSIFIYKDIVKGCTNTYFAIFCDLQTRIKKNQSDFCFLNAQQTHHSGGSLSGKLELLCSDIVCKIPLALWGSLNCFRACWKPVYLLNIIIRLFLVCKRQRWEHQKTHSTFLVFLTATVSLLNNYDHCIFFYVY